jgi:hypothetical protein
MTPVIGKATAARSKVKTILALNGIDIGTPLAYPSFFEYGSLERLDLEQIEELNNLDSIKFFGSKKDLTPECLLNIHIYLECSNQNYFPEEKDTDKRNKIELPRSFYLPRGVFPNS